RTVLGKELRIDDEDIAIPMTDRMALIRGFHGRGMLTAIDIHGAFHIHELAADHHSVLEHLDARQVDLARVLKWRRSSNTTCGRSIPDRIVARHRGLTGGRQRSLARLWIQAR